MNGTGHDIDPPLSAREQCAYSLGTLAVAAVLLWMVWRLGEALVFGGQ